MGVVLLLTFTAQGKNPDVIHRIIAGSCINQRAPQPFWEPINQHKPDLMIFAGDNIYADHYPIDQMPQEYALLGAQKGFQELNTQSKVLAIWDDHDYGINDGGADFSGKLQTKKYFLDFWKVPEDDPRRKHAGLYSSFDFGESGQHLQLILLDMRSFRSPLKRDPSGIKRYLPDGDPTLTMLGEQQWSWLEQQLQKPADLRFVVSSIQVLGDEHGFEKWANFPHEKKRLLALIKKYSHKNIVIVSGDKHRAEISALKDADKQPWLLDVTASGLNKNSLKYSGEPNRFRVGKQFKMSNFVQFDINWVNKDIDIKIYSEKGKLLQSTTYQWGSA